MWKYTHYRPEWLGLAVAAVLLVACSPRPAVVSEAVAATLTAQAPPTSAVPLDRPSSTPVSTRLPDATGSPATANPAAPATAVVDEAPAPTEGPTPAAGSAPTDAPQPVLDLGPLIFEDLFDEAGPWAVGETDDAAVAVQHGYLQFVQKSIGRFSFRLIGRMGDDFFAQVNTQIDGRCGTSDRYGMIFRLQDANNYYMFLVDCERQYRVVRVVGGNFQNVTDWTRNDAIDGGTNAANVLGVMTNGSQMRFFVNDQEVDNLEDSTFSSGRFGLWVGSAVTPNFTVRFDNLRINQLS